MTHVCAFTLHGISLPIWTIDNIIKESKSIIDTFECVIITHPYEEANLVVDHMANLEVCAKKVLF